MVVAILGFGTVGVGVYDILKERSDITVKYVLDIKTHKLEDTLSTTDINDILNDNEVETVIEVIGGLQPAYNFVAGALKKGKNVITANKFLISEKYGELTTLAKKNSVALRYTAAVGGGIPWLVNLERCARVSDIYGISGIMNGTANFILDSMHSESAMFADVLAKAQELGYAERDPSADIDGLDTLRKIVISANIAFSVAINPEQTLVAGIRYITKDDIDSCESMDSICKLMAYAVKNDNVLSVFVEPTFVFKEKLEASVKKNLNLISFDAKYCGRESFYGSGAGRYPTAYTVAQDCIDVAVGVKKAYNDIIDSIKVDNTLVSHKYYVRTNYSNAWYESLSKEPAGQGYVTQEVSVQAMHTFLKEALANGKECFIAGFSK